MLILLLELSLRFFGYGYPTGFFLEGYSPAHHEVVYTENLAFGRRFFRPGLIRKPSPVSVPRSRAEGTYRIFVLGESAAMGFPDASCSFARVLEVLLRSQYPDRNFEVVNTAMTAINSHAVLPIARDCARLEPDLFVVFMGNNEVVGPFGAAGVVNAQAGNLHLIRANLWVQRTRSGQLIGQIVRSLRPDTTGASWTGMSLFSGSRVGPDDSRLAGMYANFRQNLCDICQAGLDARAQVIACTVPVNLKDCPPFGSIHDPQLSAAQVAAFDTAYQNGVEAEKAGRFGDAVRHFDAAAAIDAQHADLAFRRARCRLALGQQEEAATEYQRARDLDALRFRADSKINQTIREVADSMASSGVHLVDAEKEFAANSPDSIPGEEFFLEHVHMTFHGNYLVAASILRTLQTRFAGQATAGAKMLTEEQCAKLLAYAEWSRFKAESIIHGMALDPPFNQQIDARQRAERLAARVAGWTGRADLRKLEDTRLLFKDALDRTPGDWVLREKLAQFLAETGDVPQAIQEYALVFEEVPHHAEAAFQLASLLFSVGRFAEAKVWLEAALKLDPDFTNAHYEYAKVLALEGREEEAITYFEARAKVEPDRAEALTQLASFLLSGNRLAAARTHLQQAFELNPNGAGPNMVMGHLLVREGSIAEALTYYDKAVEARPSLLPEVTRIRAGLK
jgi:tetratricopeptide (TPR) repeat protein